MTVRMPFTVSDYIATNQAHRDAIDDWLIDHDLLAENVFSVDLAGHVGTAICDDLDSFKVGMLVIPTRTVTFAVKSPFPAVPS